MVIIVSGNPATGKTTTAKKMAEKKGLRYIDVNQMIMDNKLYSHYDRKDRSYVVDIKKLNKFLISLIKRDRNVILDSHLTHYLPPKYVDECIITKCSLKELKRRLKRRKYSVKKIENNLECEIMDVCRIESIENGHKVKIVDTSSKAEE